MCKIHPIYVLCRNTQSVGGKKPRQFIFFLSQLMMLYEWVHIESGWLTGSSTPISIKRIDLVTSSFATYFQNIRIMYPTQKITRETSHFLMEPPDAILGPVSGIQSYTTTSPLSDGWPWYLPEKCYTLRHTLYQCSYEYAKCIQYKIYIGRRSRQSSWRKEGKWMPQFIKPYEWVCIKNGWLGDISQTNRSSVKK